MKKKNGAIIYMILVATVLISKVLGLLRNILLSTTYGTGIEASAFTAVSNLPLTLFDITFGTAISSAFIPVFNEKLSKDGNDKANHFASNFLNIVLAFSLVIVALGIAFPKVAVMLVASGFNGNAQTMELASSLMRIIIPIISFACCTFIFIGILQSYGEFIAPTLVSTFSNLCMVVYLIVFNKSFGIHGLAIAFTIGWLLQFVFLTPFLKKKKFRYSFVLKFNSPDITKVAILTLPLFVAALANPINQLISSNFSSKISESGIATVNYAYNAYFIVAGVFSYALTNMFFPEMSRRFASRDVEGATGICRDMLSSITAIILPVMTFVGICSKPIIKVLYERGKFTVDDTKNVAVLLSIYAVGMLFLSWQDILNKFFYSMQKSVIPMICAIGGISTNLLLSWTLAPRLGLNGLAIATVIAGVVMTAILCVFAKITTKIIFVKSFFVEILKLVLACAACGAVAYVLVDVLNFGASLLMNALYLVVIFVCVLVCYIGVLLLVKSENIIKIKDLINKRGKENNV